MTHQEIVVFFFSLALLLGVARLFGEFARWFRQPAVLGEILAGVILGPTVFGSLHLEYFTLLFPKEGANAITLEGITSLSVALFLLVAGMEVDLSTIFRLRYTAVIIGVSSLMVPFAMGFSMGQMFPRFVGMEPGADQMVFSLFLGIALAIAALPVIAKTLIDLRLFRSDLGMMIIAVAIFHDIVGWMIFAVILSMMKSSDSPETLGIFSTIGLTLLYSGLTLTVGRQAIDRFLPWLQAHSSWPSGILGFSVALALLGAACAEWIGIHAIFGAFIVGIAIGDSPHLQQKTRSIIEQFSAAVFAPVFFASIGLKVNFIANFDPLLVLVVVLVACVGETVGCAAGAMLAGFPKRQSWAMGFALNARGAMEIVLASLALQHGVIGERLFVALVVMALITSMIAGPLMQKTLQRKSAARLRDFLRPQGYIPVLQSTDSLGAIRELCAKAAEITGMDGDLLSLAVWEREQLMTTALTGGVAVPHAKVKGLGQPVVVVGISPGGVDFNSSDDLPANLIVLLLAAPEHAQAHLELLAKVATLFHVRETVEKAVAMNTFTGFQAVVNIAQAEAHAGSGA